MFFEVVQRGRSLLKFRVLTSLLTLHVSCPSPWVRKNSPAPLKIVQILFLTCDKKEHGSSACTVNNPLAKVRGWSVGCFGLNGSLRQYFSLYRAVSQRGRKNGEMIDKRKTVQTTPSRTYCKRSKPLPYSNPNYAPALEAYPAPSHHPTTPAKVRELSLYARGQTMFQPLQTISVCNSK